MNDHPYRTQAYKEPKPYRLRSRWRFPLLNGALGFSIGLLARLAMSDTLTATIIGAIGSGVGLFAVHAILRTGDPL